MPMWCYPTASLVLHRVRLCTQVCHAGDRVGWSPSPGKEGSSLAPRRVSSVWEAVSQGTGSPIAG